MSVQTKITGVNGVTHHGPDQPTKIGLSPDQTQPWFGSFGHFFLTIEPIAGG